MGSRTCVQCLGEKDCPDQNELCDLPTNQCMNKCTADVDCPGSLGDAFKCDQQSGRCVHCLTKNDCEDNKTCVDGLCIEPGCNSNKDCNEGLQICDPADSTCKDCLVDLDCSGRGPATPRCGADQKCVAACRSDQDCASKTNGAKAFFYCDVDSGSCLGCTKDSHCSRDQVCQNWTCVAGCTSDLECNATNNYAVCDAKESRKCVQCLKHSDCSLFPSAPR